MPSWPLIVKDTVVNLKFLALGASPVPGLLAPGIGGHFWVGGLGGLGLEGKSWNGPRLQHDIQSRELSRKRERPGEAEQDGDEMVLQFSPDSHVPEA